MLKIWDKENNQLIFLFILCIIAVYLLPTWVNQIFFLVLLVVIYRSKTDYFWLIWFYIIMDAPGRLFSSSSGMDLRLPIYPIISGIAIGFKELLLFLYIVKALQHKRNSRFLFKKHFIWFFLFTALVFFYSFSNISETLIITFRMISPWLWIFIFPVFIRDENTLAKSSRLIFPFVFLALISQIYAFFTGMYFDSFLRDTAPIIADIDSTEGTAIRSNSAGLILLFCFIQSIFYLFNNKLYFKRNYLLTVLFISFISVFLTATRGWIIAMGFIIMAVGVFMAKKKIAVMAVRTIVIMSVILVSLDLFFPVVTKQLSNSFERLSTMELLLQGDMTAGGTLSRIESRGPAVMKRFWERPVLGYGFSYEFYMYTDIHVGNQTLLMNVGILGFIFLISLYISIFLKTWRLSYWHLGPRIDNSPMRIYAISLLGVFIIHSSSMQFWGYSVYTQLFFALLLSAVNSTYLSNISSFQKPKLVSDR